MLNNTNNPMNVRTISYSSKKFWYGQTGVYKRFAVFSEQCYSFRAACHLLMWSYRKKGCWTLAQLIGRYAPTCENPTMNYLAFVSKRSGVGEHDIPRTKEQFAKIVYAMYLFENGIHNELHSWSWEDILYKVINRFNLKIYF